ncbi:MAG TPA: hypothetical protein VMO88_08045 [Acidimicrobiales bacterium]|nr:hypothetical protein [Acidimicrobiales bacterium]
MDLFTGAVGTNAGQVHDFNPGIRESGLFWTVPVPEDALEVDFEAGFATLSLHDFATEDYHNLENALRDGPEDDASVSFDMKWTATGKPFNVSDPVHTFAGRFNLANVDISWSATAPGFSFTSNPSSNVNVKSVFGRERNGIFFSAD